MSCSSEELLQAQGAARGGPHHEDAGLLPRQSPPQRQHLQQEARVRGGQKDHQDHQEGSEEDQEDGEESEEDEEGEEREEPAGDEQGSEKTV